MHLGQAARRLQVSQGTDAATSIAGYRLQGTDATTAVLAQELEAVDGCSGAITAARCFLPYKGEETSKGL